MNKTTEPDLEPLMDNAVSRLIELGYRQVCLHHEQRVIIDDEPVRIVRYQTSPPSEAREHQARLFLSHFAPEFYWVGQGEDPQEKARIRKEFATCFPQSASGDMLFVIAEATDIYGWLQAQTVPYTPVHDHRSPAPTWAAFFRRRPSRSHEREDRRGTCIHG